MKSFHTTFKTTVAIALVSLSAGAFANDIPSAPLEQAVSFAQLDMTQPAAAEQLYQKLTAVAKQVCEPVNGGLLRQKMEFRACVSETLANAVDEVNKPQLSSVHASRTGSPMTAVRVAIK
jgi:UrcA family protein